MASANGYAMQFAAHKGPDNGGVAIAIANVISTRSDVTIDETYPTLAVDDFIVDT